MTKLTDTQLIVLSKAAAREDGCAVLPDGMRAAAAAKVSGALTSRKLTREVRAKPDMPVWRRDPENRSYSLVLTAAGRKAIHVDEDERATTARVADETQTQPVDGASSTPIAAPAVGRKPRENSKQALVVKMLSAKAGTTLDALVDATGWLPHTTRAALTGLRKRGLAITREAREGKPSLYRTEAAAAA